MKKKQVVLVTKNLPPDVGGIETMWQEFIEHSSNQINLHVIGPKHAKPYINSSCNFMGTPKSLNGLLIYSLFYSLKYRKLLKGSTLISGSGVTAPIALLMKFILNSKATCYLHGLDIVYENFTYQQFNIKSIKYFDTIVANSKNTERLANSKGITRNNCTTITPGTKRTLTPKNIPKKYQIDPQRKNLLIFGRIIKRKGIPDFIKKCYPHLLLADPNFHLHIIGNSNNQYRKNDELTSLMKAIEKTKTESHITLWGQLSDHSLHQVISQCDLNIFPAIAIKNDVEGFGITILEAAQLGIKTIAFDCGGIPDAIDKTYNGQTVNAGNYDEMTKIILNHFQSTEIRAKKPYLKPGNFWNDFTSNLIEITTNPESQSA